MKIAAPEYAMAKSTIRLEYFNNCGYGKLRHGMNWGQVLLCWGWSTFITHCGKDCNGDAMCNILGISFQVIR